MSIKEELICHQCKMVLEEPVSFPCGCFICNDHITQQLKKNKEIICVSCNKIHHIPLEGFRVNKMAKKLIEQETFLSDEEKQLKYSIQSEFSIFKKSLNSNFEDFVTKFQKHFGDVREKITNRQEQLKKRIDQISTEMIENLNENEIECLQELNDKYSTLIEHRHIEENHQNALKQFRSLILNNDELVKIKLSQKTMYSTLELKLKETECLLNNIDFKPNSNFIIENDSFGRLELIKIQDSNVAQTKVIVIECKSF